MSVEENKIGVRHLYAELDRRRDTAVDDLLSSAFVAHLAGRPDLDRAGYRAAIDARYSAFPDSQHAVEDMVAEGDRVATRLTERGTHRGTFHGVAPTGTVVTMTAIGMHRFVDGRVAQLWLVADALGRLQQLGVGPSSAGG